MRELENLRKTNIRDLEVLVDGPRRRTSPSQSMGAYTIGMPAGSMNSSKSVKARKKKDVLPSSKSLKEDVVPEVVKENAPQARRQSKKNSGSKSSKRQPLRSLQDQAVSIRSLVAGLPVTAQHAEGQSSQRKRIPYRKILLDNRSSAAKKKITSPKPARCVQVPVAKNMSEAAPLQQKKRRLDDADAHARGDDETEIIGGEDTEILGEEVAHTVNATSGGVQPSGNIAKSPQPSERLEEDAESDAAIDEVIREICQEASPLQEKAKGRVPQEQSEGIDEFAADYEKLLERYRKQGRTVDGANCCLSCGASMQQPSLEKTVKDLEMSVKWYHKAREECEEGTTRNSVLAKHYGDMGQANSSLKNRCTELWHKCAELEDTRAEMDGNMTLLLARLREAEGERNELRKMDGNVTLLLARLREVEGERDELRKELDLSQQTCRCARLGAAGNLVDNDKGSVPGGGADVQTEEPRDDGNVGTTPGPVRGNPPGLNGRSEAAMEIGDCEHRNGSQKATGEGSVESDEKNGLDSGVSARIGDGETRVASPVPIVPLEPHKCVSPLLEAVNSPQMNAASHPWGSMLSTPPVVPNPPPLVHAANGWASQLGTPFGDKTPAWLGDRRRTEPTPTVVHAMRHSTASGWKEMMVRAASHMLPSSPPAPCGDPMAVNGTISGGRSSQNQPVREVELSPYVQTGARPGVRGSNGREVEEEGGVCSYGLGSGPSCPGPGSEQLALERQMLPLADAELSFEKLLKFLTGFKVEWAAEETTECVVLTHEATGYSFSLTLVEDSLEDVTEANGASANCIEQPELQMEYKPIEQGKMMGRLPRCLEDVITVSVVDGPNFQRRILNCIHS